jgi:hypothetical protein
VNPLLQANLLAHCIAQLSYTQFYSQLLHSTTPTFVGVPSAPPFACALFFAVFQ